MPTSTIRLATSLDVDRIKDIAADSGMVTKDVVGFSRWFAASFVGGPTEGHQWLVSVDDAGEVCGAACYAPEPFSDRTWNLHFLAVDPCQQKAGHGTNLLSHIEYTLAAMGPKLARVLIVEATSSDHYAAARLFYIKRGYFEESRLRQFYGPDSDKITFWKSLV